MNTQESFNLNKLRCEVAMQQALQSWQPKPQIYGMECPKCKSHLLGKHGREPDGVQRYICKNCSRVFRARPLMACNCLIPGKELSCQSCPQFQEFLDIVKQKMDILRFLSFEELQNLKVSHEVTQNAKSIADCE
ncbi:IS1 family transposase [Nostoc paludosum FACHB-159]|uniref:IS1 family transposase n=2 Tax=Nostoc TaxID=1177 RepID=A0ABR8KGX5_9NOSO|nr:IS1 family transposase [Nostoc sp. FACHB-857]MBD2738119.1 IS1 family transposase [Nostoc paludosum FACHB-159]